ncbi:glycosyltransferase family 2 protein [Solibacillus sp. A46]|uniref:Glycosyltransferase family 2 protein n=1 Tax=Solibacillus faecavium TaxID=2762221 RepID=A0ABR8Y0N8_9BACL|nr:glycosyltransferase family 2 protein [Solibacillus faecavium]MBD8037771.1 glycosyltransferase family 2 protein [Solibacillus faecavium]
MELPFSIVITTYNRKYELMRCLKSIFDQSYKKYEVIVVDDFSKPSYQDYIITNFPNVNYVYRENNSGPGENRNKGIEVAKHNYVIIMDDDDIFHKDAFTIINQSLQSIENIDQYPVVNFLRSNARLNYQDYFRVNTFENLTKGVISGDVTHVINKKLFNEFNYKFPSTRIGGELLLWFEVALKNGYPIFNQEVVQLMDDSEDRLTNFDYQVKRANLFKEYQMEILDKFEGDLLEIGNYPFLITKYKGAIIYALLDGDKKSAYKYITRVMKYSKKQAIFLLMLIFPKVTIKKLLFMYRKSTG